MSIVKTLNVNGINLEYVQKEDDIYILNTNNRRYIIANEEVLDFFKSYNDCSEKNIEIEDYLYKNKTDIFNMKILNFKIKSSVLDKSIKLLNYLFNNFMFFVSIFSIIFIPKIILSIYGIKVRDINIKSIITLLLIELIICFIHELGHYQEYLKTIKREYCYFGIGLRYLCFTLFYIDVPFLSTLNKNSKIKVILSGVRNQFILNAIFTLIYMITNSQVVLYSIFTNWLIIIINLLPFMKLDGFWAINTLINTKNYMDDFIIAIKTRKKVKPIIVVLGILNIIIISFIILVTLFDVINIISCIRGYFL